MFASFRSSDLQFVICVLLLYITNIFLLIAIILIRLIETKTSIIRQIRSFLYRKLIFSTLFCTQFFLFYQMMEIEIQKWGFCNSVILVKIHAQTCMCVILCNSVRLRDNLVSMCCLSFIFYFWAFELVFFGGIQLQLASSQAVDYSYFFSLQRQEEFGLAEYPFTWYFRSPYNFLFQNSKRCRKTFLIPNFTTSIEIPIFFLRPTTTRIAMNIKSKYFLPKRNQAINILQIKLFLFLMRLIFLFICINLHALHISISGLQYIIVRI